MGKLIVLIAAASLGFSLSIGASESALGPYSGMASDDPAAIWSAWGGRTTLRMDQGLLDNYQLELERTTSSATSDVPDGIGFRILPLGTLDVWAPAGAFDGFRAGSLVHEGGLTITSPAGSLTLENFSLRPSNTRALSLEVVSANGRVLFIADHIHSMLRPDDQVLTLWNMDLRLSQEAAVALGYPELADEVLGQAFTYAELIIPSGAETRGACSSPNWENGNQFRTDVALVNIGSFGQRAREAGVRVVIAPSATLKNVGTAEVPWVQKFTTPANGTYPQPYNRDQHPFLVWAMYHLDANGVFRQLAVSQAKHAFLTVNSACSCNAGSILWAAASSPNGVGCEDTYGQGNNDSPPDLGPRDEIPSLTGEWEQCGSFFAPGATAPGPCNQTNNGATGDEFERRMVVAEPDLISGNSNYWAEAWYVIRDDINIFNSMGYRPVTPTQGGTGNWTFALGAYVNGGAVDAWIAPGTATATERHQRVTTASGHFSVAARAIDLGGGTTRLVYNVMNYDYDDQFRSFSIPAAGALAGNIEVFTPDGSAWTMTQGPSELRFDAPAGTGLDWGHMLTVTYTVDTDVEVGQVTFDTLETVGVQTATTLIHSGDLDRVFGSGFE